MKRMHRLLTYIPAQIYVILAQTFQVSSANLTSAVCSWQNDQTGDLRAVERKEATYLFTESLI